MNRRGQSFNWTPARIDQLTSLVESGLSARQIAAEMGCGLTRNSIIGKVTRLGLSFGRKHGARDLPPDFVPPPEPTKPEPVLITAPADKDPRLCITRGCRNTRLRQNLHRLCHEHDQQRIAAKKTAA